MQRYNIIAGCTKEHVLYSSCLVVWLNTGELVIKSCSETDS